MFITRLRLNNYCQHADLDLVFTGNLIAVVGRNGTGKSNLLGSLQFAFTGSVPEVDKSALLSDGAAEGSVTVDFTHGGSSFQVSRRLDKPEATLLAGDVVLATGVKAVNAAISELLGLDNDIARHSVFVRQAELNDIIFTEAAVRQRAWQAMVGLGSADKIHETIRKCMADIPEHKDYGPLLEEAGTAYRVERYAYAAAKKAYTECRTKLRALGPPPDVARIGKLQELQTAARTEADLLARQPQLKYALDLCTAQMLDATNNEAMLASAQGPEDLVTLQGQLTTAKQELANIAARDNLARDLEQMTAKLVVLQQSVPPVNPEELTAQINQATSMIGAHSGEAGVCQNLHKALSQMPAAGALTVCPVCESQLSDPRQAIERMAVRISKLLGEIAGMNEVKMELFHKLKTYQNAHDAMMTCSNLCNNTKSRLVELTAGIDATVTPSTVANLELRMANARRTIEARQAVERTISNVRTELGIAQSRLDENIKSTQAIAIFRAARESELQVSAIAVVDELNNLATSMHAHTNAKDALSVQAAKLATARAMVRRLIATLRKLRKEDGAQEGLRKLTKTVELVRNWFHFSQGPRMVVVDILDQLTPDINTLLAKFGSPYTVMPDYDNVLFKYIKGTGASAEPQSVLRLSGGERVMLATSFRISSYCMFASKLGLLTLDEPTAYLDSQNVQLFAHLVEKLREITTSLKLQLFMSTHEEAIIPLCDTVVNLNQTTTE